MGVAVFPPYSLASGQTMVGVMVVMATSFERTYASMCHSSSVVVSVPDPTTGHCWPTPPQGTPGDSQASLTASWRVNVPFSWVLVHTMFCLCLPRVWKFVPSQSCRSSVIKSNWPSKSISLRAVSPFARSPGWGICVGPRTFATVREFLCYNSSPVCGLSAQWLYGGAIVNLLIALFIVMLPNAPLDFTFQDVWLEVSDHTIKVIWVIKIFFV